MLPDLNEKQVRAWGDVLGADILGAVVILLVVAVAVYVIIKLIQDGTHPKEAPLSGSDFGEVIRALSDLRVEVATLKAYRDNDQTRLGDAMTSGQRRFEDIERRIEQIEQKVRSLAGPPQS